MKTNLNIQFFFKFLAEGFLPSLFLFSVVSLSKPDSFVSPAFSIVFSRVLEIVVFFEELFSTKLVLFSFLRTPSALKSIPLKIVTIFNFFF